MNPCREQEMNAIRAANLLINQDPAGMAWIRANREPAPDGAEAGGGRRGGTGRRRRG